MFNIGPAELMVVLLIALVVLGPSKLPDAARQVGKALGQLRSLSSGFQAEMRDALKEPVDGKPSSAGSTAKGGGALSAPNAGTEVAPAGDDATTSDATTSDATTVSDAVPAADGPAPATPVAPATPAAPDAGPKEPSVGAPARGAPADATEPGTNGAAPN